MLRVCFNKPFRDSIDSSFKTNGLNVGLNNIVFFLSARRKYRGCEM